MGFIKAAIDSAKAGFANQWLEYMTVPAEMDGQTIVARAVPMKKEGSANNDGQEDAYVISDGSNFEVPENTALVLIENGGITAVIAEAGRYTYTTENVPEARSLFAGDGFFASTFGQSWQQFKYGGQPSNKQLAFYVNLRPIAGLKFGTTNPIRYQDARYRNIHLAVTCNGTYTVKIVDPILAVKNMVDPSFFTGQTSKKVYTMKDMGVNGQPVEESLFSGFVGSIGAALSQYSRGGKSIDDIQAGMQDFVLNMNTSVEQGFHWATLYGLSIISIETRGLDWDQASLEKIDKFNETALEGQAQAESMGAIGEALAADGGRVGAAYSQATIAQGFKAAGENGGAQGMFGIGMAINQMGGTGSLISPVGGMPAAPAAPAGPAPVAPAPAAPAAPAPEAPAAAPAPAPEAPAAPAAQDLSGLSEDDLAAMRASGIDPTAQ